eukprot:2688640-Amphidinium_carterae.1
MPQRPLGLADVGQRGQAVVVELAMLFYMEQKLDALRGSIGDGARGRHCPTACSDTVPGPAPHAHVGLCACGRLSCGSSAQSFEADSTDYVQAPLDILLKFHSRLKLCTSQMQHSAASLAWLQARDEEEREEWVYHQREAMWMVPKFTETSGRQAQGSNSQCHSRQPAPKQTPAQTSRLAASSVQRPPAKTTAFALKNGKEVCVAWNKGNCREPCPQGKLHVCNAIISKSGR